MSSGRDQQSPAGAQAEPDSAIFDFVGPLRPAEHAWAEHVLRADSSAALSESSDVVIRRREAHIGGLYRMAALLSLGGDLTGSHAAGFRAVAESRALAEFMADSPAYCLECFLLGDHCERHKKPPVRSGGSAESEARDPEDPGDPGDPGSGTDRQQPGHQPEWRRFGADESPSASG